MGPLLKVTRTPYEAVQITENARLISDRSVDIERQKAIARHMVFRNRTKGSGGGGVDLEYVNQVNKAFSNKTATAAKVHPGNTATAPVDTPDPMTTATAAKPVAKLQVKAADIAAPASSSGQITEIPTDTAVSTPETQADYTMQRASFEWRVASGELSYVPPLVMTIITQRPEIHFEYTGGYNYVPRSSNPNYS